MKIKRVFLIITIILLSYTIVMGENILKISPDDIIEEIEESFKNEANRRETPDSILTAQEKILVEKSYKYMEKFQLFFDTDNPRSGFKLNTVSSYHNRDITVKLDQHVNGITVKDGYYNFIYRSDGTFVTLEGNAYPDAWKVDTKPIISEEEAKQIALDHPKSKGSKLDDINGIVRPYIMGDMNYKFYLIWEVNVLVNIQSLFFYIDAKTGKVLRIVRYGPR